VAGGARRGLSLLDRWEQYVERDGPGGCWTWVGYCDPNGYGRLSIDDVPVLAHHIAYRLLIGPIPDGLELDHTCVNPPCVNPDHLFEGTQADNIADAVAKGRALVGALNPRSLTPEVVAAIREAAGTGRQVAARFGVAQTTVAVIRRGEHWTSVQAERSA
jgi:hypothetical protein